MVLALNDLSRTFVRHQAELESAALRVLRSGWYVMGPEHDAFEREFADYLGVEHCVAVANGTDALELALQSAGVGPGAAVMTAANAGGYTATAAGRLGGRVVWADVDAKGLLDPASVKEHLDAGVVAVVVTHLYGQMADVEGVRHAIGSRPIVVIEDVAQAAGARRDGRSAGAWGDLATFSFYPTKNLAALGDGGAVTTPDAARADEMRRWRQYGWSSKYEVAVTGGRNSRLDELQAAVLRAGLAWLDEANGRRRSIAAAYAAALTDGVVLLGSDDESYVAHLVVLATERRDALASHLASKGIQTAVHYPIPDHRQPAWATQIALPRTERLASSVLTVPGHPELSDGEVADVCRALATFAG